MKHCLEITLRLVTPWQIGDEASEATGKILASFMNAKLKESLALRQTIQAITGQKDLHENEPGDCWCARIERVPVNANLGDK